MGANTNREVTINGTLVECVTIAGLANMSGKSPITLRKWEAKGWLPLANFRMPATIIAGEERQGERLYSKKYVGQMSDQVKRVVRGEEIPHEVKQQLFAIFKKERDEFLK